ncbi:peptidase domain-containing ABC transporter [Corynebacterium sp. CNJ-954]|uniref:peptidase domain-containing ABC transporter n=1 Tax=Corynebacterium sp. CNJ-954 TaxID=1904962 RepID=UPI00096A7E13|nr:ATP-binding cassette domain-containing protein [Corynebacterium sp. CNJ-954]
MKKNGPTRQLKATDCGIACSHWLLCAMGGRISYSEVARVVDTGRSGISLLDIKRIISGFGVGVKAYKGSIVEAVNLGPLVVGWNGDHFLCVYGVNDDGDALLVMDPASGYREISIAEVELTSTGPFLCLAEGSDAHRSKRFRKRTAILWRYAQPRRFELVAIALIAMCSSAILTFPPRMVGSVVDEVSRSGIILSRETYIQFALIMGLVVAYSVLSLIRAELANYVERSFERELGKSIGLKVYDLSLAEMGRVGIGNLLTKFASLNSVRDIIASRVLSIISDMVMFLVLAFSVALISGYHFVLLVMVAALAIGIGVSVAPAANRFTEDIIRASSRAQGTLVQDVSGFDTLKANGLEEYKFGNWFTSYVDQVRSVFKRQQLDLRVGVLFSTLDALAPLLWLILGLFIMSTGGVITIGDLVTLVTLCSFALAPIQRVGANLQIMLGAGAEIDNVSDLLDLPGEDFHPGGIMIARVNELSAHDLRVGYPGDSDLVLDGVSLALKEGEKVLICGPSGVGKSTLVRSLLGLNESGGSAVFWDGTDMSDINLRSLRSQVGYSSQKNSPVSGSVREIVTSGRSGFSDSDVWKALRVACLDSVVAKLPIGLSSYIDDSNGVSGGQLQRLWIAQAVLGVPGVILLDEPTANLDKVTEEHVMVQLVNLDSTVCVVSHNSDMAPLFDRVVNLGSDRQS